MLRKRTRSQHKDQNMGHIALLDSSISDSQSDLLSQKHKTNSFFSIPGLLDSDSVRSPTSPLDCRVFSSLSNPFRSPKLSQKSWDCSKVGLSIIDSLDDDTNLSGKSNILFGTKTPNSQGKTDNFEEPKISAISPRTQHNCPTQTEDSDVLFGNRENSGETNSFAKIPYLSFSLAKSVSLQTMNSDRNSNFGNSDNLFGFRGNSFESEQFGKIRSFSLGSSGLSVSSLSVLPHPQFNLTNSQMGISDLESNMKSIRQPNSIQLSLSSGHELMGSLSASDIELSEDYTCVISHGPNPKTTHIFGDRILECHTNDLSSINLNTKQEQENEFPPTVEISGFSASFPSSNFLSYCHYCKKKLEEGKDIYIYRGEKAFCSWDCRSQEILLEEGWEEFTEDPSCCEDVDKSCIFIAN